MATDPRVPPLYRTERMDPGDVNPGPYPSLTPVGEVLDGTQAAPGPGPGPGPVQVIRLGNWLGNTQPTVGVADGYQLPLSPQNTAQNPVWQFQVVGNTDPLVQIQTGGGIPADAAIVTWGTAGTHTLRATVTDGGAGNSPQSSDLSITVAAVPINPINISITSTDFTDGNAIPNVHSYAGVVSNGCTGSNTSPQLTITLNDETGVDTISLIVSDIDAGFFRHWAFEFPVDGSLTYAIAQDEDVATTLNAIVGDNDWIGIGANDTNPNGWGGPCPPQGDGAHRYRFTARAFAANGDNLALGSIEGTFVNGVVVQAQAVATNNALNITDDVNIGAPSTPAQRTLIQNAFNAAVTRVNATVSLTGAAVTNTRNAINDQTWDGMTVPEVRCERRPVGDPNLASMFTFLDGRDWQNGIATSCAFMAINLTNVTDEATLTTVIAHELIHGLGCVPFARFVGAIDGDELLDALRFPNAFAAYQNLTSTTATVGTLTTPDGGGHWSPTRETINGVEYPGYTNELMLPFITVNPVISEATIQYLVDQGYTAGTPEGVPGTLSLPLPFAMLPVSQFDNRQI